MFGEVDNGNHRLACGCVAAHKALLGEFVQALNLRHSYRRNSSILMRFGPVFHPSFAITKTPQPNEQQPVKWAELHEQFVLEERWLDVACRAIQRVLFPYGLSAIHGYSPVAS